MSLMVGNIIPRRLYKGSSLVNRVYKGDALQWERLTREGRSFVSPADGEVSLDTIYGKSLVWNQLVVNGDFSDGDSSWIRAMASWSVTSGAMTFVAIAKYGRIEHDVKLVASHKYFIGATINSGDVVHIQMRDQSLNAAYLDNEITNGRNAFVFSVPSSFSSSNLTRIRILNYAVSDWKEVVVEKVVLIDLTLMFGVGNEPSTVEEFEALFPEPYYDYDTGSILNLGARDNAIDIAVKGFNLWDEEWELGGINGQGQKIANNDRIRTKNYIPVISEKTYYFKSANTLTSGDVFYYDANKVFISGQYNRGNRTFTTPANCAFIRCGFTEVYGTTYNHDICINISNPTYNGQYKPYQQEKTVSIPLTALTSNDEFIFPDGVCGIGTVCDEVGQSKVIKRIGSRPYTAGDEGDSSVMTDGAVTRYVLTSPIEYPLDIPFKVEYKIVEGGSESLVGLTAPIKEDIALNYK